MKKYAISKYIIGFILISFLLLILNYAVISFHKNLARRALLAIREELVGASITITNKGVVSDFGFFPIKNTSRINNVLLHASNGVINFSARIPELKIKSNIFGKSIKIYAPEKIALLSTTNREEFRSVNFPDFAVDLHLDKHSVGIVKLKRWAVHFLWSGSNLFDYFACNLKDIEVRAANEDIMKGKNVGVLISDVKSRNIMIIPEAADSAEIRSRTFIEGKLEVAVDKLRVTKPHFFGSYADYIEKFGTNNIKLKAEREYDTKYGNSSKYTIDDESFISSDLFGVKGGGVLYAVWKVAKAKHTVNYAKFDTHIRNYNEIIDIIAHSIKSSIEEMNKKDEAKSGAKSSAKSSANEVLKDFDKNRALFKFASKHVLANGDPINADIVFEIRSPKDDLEVNGYKLEELFKKMDTVLPKEMQ